MIFDIGLAILNRWHLYAWQRFTHRDIKIANAVVSVAAGAVAVDLPTGMDVFRSVRIAGGALLPLSEVREADFAAISPTPACFPLPAPHPHAKLSPVQHLKETRCRQPIVRVALAGGSCF